MLQDNRKNHNPGFVVFMPTQRTCLILIAFLQFAPIVSGGEKAGSISGVVRFTGESPPAKKITTSDGGTIVHNDLVVDAKSKGLRDVVAIFDNAPAQPKVRNARPVVVDQREMIFVPRVVAVQHGQAVSFDNSDMFNHSVMANSKVAANRFNIFVSPGKPYEHVFEVQPRPIPIGCSLHSWMRAWVYVVPHPWFAVSNEQGRFEIKTVPPGKYTLSLHHADTGMREEREVEVTAGKSVEIAVEWRKVEGK